MQDRRMLLRDLLEFLLVFASYEHEERPLISHSEDPGDVIVVLTDSLDNFKG